MNAQIGDWIRFYRNELLVIGVVQYVSRDTLGYAMYDTDIGQTSADSVREVRPIQKETL